MIDFILNNKYKNIKRYREISQVLAKYGFSIMADKLHNKSFIKTHFLKKSNDISSKYNRAQRIRMALEELGPTFIKLGQILSTRYDILPEDIVDELSRLQDNVNEYPVEKAKEIFKKELNKDIDEIFSDFNETPIAAASIGQVYKGRLKNGRNVVIKIQRPNIRKIIFKDLNILFSIAKLVDEHFNKKNPVKYVDVVEEFSYLLKKELDYTYEAQNCENFREKFKDDDRIFIPKVYWEYTTKKILVTEMIHGAKLSDFKKLEDMAIDKSKIAHLGAQIFMEQIFIHGFFHGDPHPGNIFVINNNKIGFVDFGIVGYLDKETLSFIVTMLKAGSKKDATKIVEALEKMNAIPVETDEMNLKRELNVLLNYYYNVPFDKLNFSDALNDLLRISYRHNIKIPSQLVLLIKSVVTIEGVSKKLNPDFSLIQLSDELLIELKKQKFNFNRILSEGAEMSLDTLKDLKDLPRLLKQVFHRIEKNKLKITLKIEGFNELKREINIMTNKVSLSLMVSALVVGSSIVIQSKTGPTLLGMNAMGFIGFSFAGILGMILTISILMDILRYRK